MALAAPLLLTHVPFAQVPEASVRLAPLASLAQRSIVLHIAACDAHVQLVQGPNLSWLGYPQDTNPSSRDLLPGLARPGGHQVMEQALLADGRVHKERLCGPAVCEDMLWRVKPKN